MDEATLRIWLLAAMFGTVAVAFSGAALYHCWVKHRGWTVAVAYILTALFTNAYIQTHRYANWFRNEAVSNPDAKETRAGVRVMFATFGWPVYWTTTGFMYLLEDDSQQGDGCACGNCG